jgi:hypothetical protein
LDAKPRKGAEEPRPRRAGRVIGPRGVGCLAVHYREHQPTFIPPMLLSSGPVPAAEGWTLELKWDG